MLDSIKCSDKSQWLISEHVNKEESSQTTNKTDEISIMIAQKPIDGKITSESLKEVLNKEVFFSLLVVIKILETHLVSDGRQPKQT